MRNPLRRARSAPAPAPEPPAAPARKKKKAPSSSEAGADRGARYRDYVAAQLASGDPDEALRHAIGGSFDSMGLIQRDLLISQGLQPDGVVVDVGCGSGRLALPLSTYLDERGHYVGTDVVPALVDYAQRLVQRPDWDFHVVDELVIPAPDHYADIVCMFSVVTHLRHEHSFLYLKEAKRVVKPTGRIVVSFLEFAVYAHWGVFAHNVRRPYADKPLDQFLSRDALESFAHHLDLDIVALHGGDEMAIPLRQTVQMDHGATYTDAGSLGQSFVVFARKS